MSWENADYEVVAPSVVGQEQNQQEQSISPEVTMEKQEIKTEPLMPQTYTVHVTSTKEFIQKLFEKKNGISSLPKNVRDYIVPFLYATKATNISEAIKEIKSGIQTKQGELTGILEKQKDLKEKEDKRKREINFLLQLEKTISKQNNTQSNNRQRNGGRVNKRNKTRKNK
jgi:hypothetical protein